MPSSILGIPHGACEPAAAAQDTLRQRLQADSAGLANLYSQDVYSGLPPLQAAAGAQQARNIAMMNIMGNRDADHVRDEWDSQNVDSYPAYPQVMGRIGVPRDVFDADMAILKGYAARINKDLGRDLAVGAATLCLGYIFLTCVKADHDSIYKRRAKAHIDDMKQRYAPAGVTWNFRFVPYVGTFISYET